MEAIFRHLKIGSDVLLHKMWLIKMTKVMRMKPQLLMVLTCSLSAKSSLLLGSKTPPFLLSCVRGQEREGCCCGLDCTPLKFMC